jgi:hypothetical protein
MVLAAGAEHCHVYQMKEEKMKIKMLGQTLVFAIVSAAAGTVNAQGQMPSNSPMKGGMMNGQGMSSCPMMSEDMGLMHDPEVKMSVTDTADGFSVKWSSSNPDKAAALKKMGAHMKSMHAQKTSGAPTTN